jgi:hypothetical protein
MMWTQTLPAILDTSPSPGFLPWATWRACLTAAAVHGRESLAAEIAATADVLAHFAGAEAIQAITQALRDVTRWWP